MCLSFGNSAALAQSIMGTWHSPVDRKGQSGQVDVRPCGVAFCGKLVRTYDVDGSPVTLPTTGLELFWDMVETRPGFYDNGKVYVPLMDRAFKATIEIRGDLLILQGCFGLICKKHVWRRVS